MNFNLNNTPPSAAELAERRREMVLVLARCRQRESWSLDLLWAICFVEGGTAFMAWRAGVITSDFIFVVGFAGFFTAAFLRCTEDYASSWHSALSGVAVGGLIALVGGIATAKGGFTEISTASIAVAVAIVPALLVGLPATAILYDKFIDAPRHQANQGLSGFVELEASSLPEECIDFLSWVESDETIRTYQRQIAATGRKPVMAEYEAAKAWVGDRERRLEDNERRERARQACARMAALT